MVAGIGVGDWHGVVGCSGTEFLCQCAERNFYFHPCRRAGAGVPAVAMAAGIRGRTAGIPKNLSLRAKPVATEQRDAARAYRARKRSGAIASVGVARSADCASTDDCAGRRLHQYWNWRAAAD